jgi:hypothetical protein
MGPPINPMTAPVPAPVAMPPDVRPGSLLPQPANAIAKPQQIVNCRFMVTSLERCRFQPGAGVA